MPGSTPAPFVSVVLEVELGSHRHGVPGGRAELKEVRPGVSGCLRRAELRFIFAALRACAASKM